MEAASRGPLRTYAVPLATLTVGGALTAFTSFAPFIHFAYHGPSAHLVLETCAALVALLAAYLLFGRFRTSRRANDLALIYPLALFAASNIYVSFILLITQNARPTSLQEWIPPLIRLIAAATFALAAFVPPQTLARPIGGARFIAAASLCTLSVITAAIVYISGVLPDAAGSASAPTPAPTGSGNHAQLGIYAAAGVLFLLASAGFARAEARDRDELMLWLSAGAAIAAVASLHYFLSPVRLSDWVYTGDFFRIGFYALLLIGAAREIEKYWEGRAAAAVLEERRRLARDLHDGVAQELAYMWRHTRRLAASQNGIDITALSSSVERALHESRRAIATLRTAPSESLATAMAEAVEPVAKRVGTKVVVDVDESVVLAPERREQLLRIASEAVANAGRHGRARIVRVEVWAGDRTRLRVIDDGTGFDTAVPRTAKFGLLSMEERARAMGGRLHVMSRPGSGTRVEVVLP